MSERRTRARILFADNVELVVLALLVVTAAGAFVTYTTHVEPGTTTEEREVASWESSGEFFHRATVRDGTAVYPEGTVLHNQSVYFQRVTPELDGVFAYDYAASDGGDLTVETEVTLLLQSVESEAGANRTVYWQTEDRLASATETAVGSGERVSVPFDVNVTAANQRAAAIDEQFGGTPGTTQVLVVVEVGISGDRNGRSVAQTRTYRLPVTSQGSVYRVDDPGPVVASDTRTERVTVPAEYGPLRSAGGPILLAVGLAGLSAVGYHRRNAAPVTEAERDWLDYRRSRGEFDEWITAGRVPRELTETPVVRTASLSGLVDVAIDTDRRVIEDEDRGAYFVLGESHWYRYETPPEPDRGRAEHSSGSDGDGSIDGDVDEPLDPTAPTDDGETPDVLDDGGPARDG
jgi:hypothetical protein